MVYSLLSGPMVYTLFPCFPRKMVYTMVHSFFCSVTSGSGNRPRKGGCHGGGMYSFFFPWNKHKFKSVVGKCCRSTLFD